MFESTAQSRDVAWSICVDNMATTQFCSRFFHFFFFYFIHREVSRNTESKFASLPVTTTLLFLAALDAKLLSVPDLPAV